MNKIPLFKPKAAEIPPLFLLFVHYLAVITAVTARRTASSSVRQSVLLRVIRSITVPRRRLRSYVRRIANGNHVRTTAVIHADITATITANTLENARTTTITTASVVRTRIIRNVIPTVVYINATVAGRSA